MEEEDDDQRLLHSLGVTSANIKDIERKILSEAKTDPKHDTESGPSVDGRESSKIPEADDQAKLHQKLRSVQLEIDAVASTIKGAKHAVGQKSNRLDSTDAEDKKKKKHVDGTAQDTPHGGALQEALAAERLKSLKKAKAQIQKEILQSDPCPSSPDNQTDKMLAMLVEEERRRKKPAKLPGGPKEMSTRRLKTVTYNDDNDFDAVLDGASVGFMETEREELIRKGFLTLFHKLKGFEKRVEQPGPSRRQNDSAERTEQTMEATSIAKVAQSMQQIAQNRPATKLLDAESLPRLDAPTAPFQRLGRPLKRPVSPSSDQQEKKRRRNKIKRPLPGKKWRQDNLRKESLLDVTDEYVGDAAASFSEDEDQSNRRF